MKKITFFEFLKEIYDMEIEDYNELNWAQKKAVEVVYLDHYGSPIKYY